MKKLLLIIAISLFLAGPLYAGPQTVRMEWDANDPAEGVTGYGIWASNNVDGPWMQLNPESEPVIGTTYEYVYTGEVEQEKFFYVKATDGRNWSGPSNVVDLMIDTKVPANVQTLTISSD